MEALIKNYTGISAPDLIQGPSDECQRNPEGCERITSDDPEIKKKKKVIILNVEQDRNKLNH